MSFQQPRATHDQYVPENDCIRNDHFNYIRNNSDLYKYNLDMANRYYNHFEEEPLDLTKKEKPLDLSKKTAKNPSMTYSNIVSLLHFYKILDEKYISIIGSPEQFILSLHADFLEKKKVYIICHNNHWFTCVYLRENLFSRIVFWDSLGKAPPSEYLNQILLFNSSIEVRHFPVCLQKDSKSCGWFAVFFAFCFIKRIDTSKPHYSRKFYLSLNEIKKFIKEMENKKLPFIGKFNSINELHDSH